MSHIARLALVTVLLAPSLAFAQTSKSTPLAAELSKLLDAQKLDAFAARQSQDVFVSTLYFPGAQLLVVGAKYAVPERLIALIKEKNYRDVYADLSSASEQATRLFVMDFGGNGLRFKLENNQLDTADVAGKSISFDGEWGRAKISEAEYRKVFESTDERYAQMLQSLIDALKTPQ